MIKDTVQLDIIKAKKTILKFKCSKNEIYSISYIQ